MSVTADQEGGCQCGAIRFRLLRAPIALYACHCVDCQKQSSSAFGLSMWMERDAVEFTGAKPQIYRTCGESGREKVGAYIDGLTVRLRCQFPIDFTGRRDWEHLVRTLDDSLTNQAIRAMRV